MLATRGKAQCLRCFGTELDDPVRKPPGINQFTRVRCAIYNLNIWIKTVRLVKAANRGGKSLRIGRLKFF